MITDYDIQAYIDSELDHMTAKKVEKSIEKNIYTRQRYKVLVRQKKLLQSWWRAAHKH